ncbi:MAG TPA: hypothetical protein VFO91_07680, partial [Anaerolineales bacterium]|nr:hypothetical protein [Anaerolineales bacterium]
MYSPLNRAHLPHALPEKSTQRAVRRSPRQWQLRSVSGLALRLGTGHRALRAFTYMARSHPSFAAACGLAVARHIVVD